MDETFKGWWQAAATLCLLFFCLIALSVPVQASQPPDPLESSTSNTLHDGTEKKDDGIVWPQELEPSLREHLQDVCERYEVPLPVMLAIIEQESGFDQQAVSSTNDYGLCQINQSNHGWLLNEYGLEVVGSAEDNLEAGVLILHLNLKQADGNLLHAITGYQSGNTRYISSYARNTLLLAERSYGYVPLS